MSSSISDRPKVSTFSRKSADDDKRHLLYLDSLSQRQIKRAKLLLCQTLGDERYPELPERK